MAFFRHPENGLYVPEAPLRHPEAPLVHPEAVLQYPQSASGQILLAPQSFLVEIVASSGSYLPTDEASPVWWFDMLDPAKFVEVANVMQSITNKVSDVVWNAGTMPSYSATGLLSKPSMVFNGSSHIITSTEAAVVTALTNAPALTVYFVGATADADSTRGFFGSGNSGVATNQTRRFGTITTGLGRWNQNTTSDAGAGVNVTSGADIDTNPHFLAWFSSGTQTGLDVDGVNVVALTAHNPGTNTPNRAALGGRPDSAPDGFWSGGWGECLGFAAHHDAAARDRVYQYLLAKWTA